jgi:hypothetical protein
MKKDIFLLPSEFRFPLMAKYPLARIHFVWIFEFLIDVLTLLTICGKAFISGYRKEKFHLGQCLKGRI